MRRLIPYTMMIALILTFVGCGGDNGPSGPGDISESENPIFADLDITSSTTGDDMDPNGYTVTIDGDSVNTVDANGSVNIAELQEGSYDVKFTDVRDNCKIDGDNPQTVDIAAGNTESLSFDVSCEAAIVNKIVYTSDSGGNNEIYVMNTDGSSAAAITNNGVSEYYPEISPDGTRILFVKKTGGPTSNWQYFTIDVNGSNEQELTSPSEGATLGDTPRATWSPDGAKILFISSRDGNAEIYKMNADGSDQERITNDPARDRLSKNVFSADGSKFVFSSKRASGSDYEIFTADADGSNFQQVTDNDDRDFKASFSPDDSKIAFVSYRDSGTGVGAVNPEVYTMDNSGNNTNRLTNESNVDDSPVWSAGGDSIIFESNRNGDFELFSIAADGSGSASNLTNTSANNERSPSVSLLQ